MLGIGRGLENRSLNRGVGSNPTSSARKKREAGGEKRDSKSLSSRILFLTSHQESVAELVRRLVATQQIAGSNPVGFSNKQLAISYKLLGTTFSESVLTANSL